jgi:hypothetical protein
MTVTCIDRSQIRPVAALGDVGHRTARVVARPYRFAASLILIVAVAVTSGCGTERSSAARRLTIETGDKTGVYFLLGRALADIYVFNHAFHDRETTFAVHGRAAIWRATRVRQLRAMTTAIV